MFAPPDRRSPFDVRSRRPAIVRVAFVSTYPPRPCGIASFTHQLAGTINDREVVALPWAARSLSYPHEVHHRLRGDVQGELVLAARELSGCVDVVSIQHHPDLWGGPEHADVLDFIGALERPAVVTLHAVTSSPSAGHRALIRELTAQAAATVTMSDHARTVLEADYGIDPGRLTTIAHGVADVPILDADPIKTGLGLAGRNVILTFGLLTRRKGVEQMLRALPKVVQQHPKALYAIVGATHPDTLDAEGERYRQSLEALVASLHLAGHVQFVDHFAGRVELIRWLQAADVVVTPYTDLDQSVAGTLVAAMGTGRAVVSTPYAYANELLANDRGVLVAPNSPSALAQAVSELLSDDDRRAAIGRRAHEWTRAMTWTNVGNAYARLFDQVTVGTSRRVLPATRMGSRRPGVASRR